MTAQPISPAFTSEIERARCAHLTPVEVKLARLWLGVEPRDVAGPPDGLLVGECPGPHTSARLPLFPFPASSAGGRLLKISGMKAGEFLGRFARRNLFREHVADWRAPAAREAARQVKDWIAEQGSYRVLLLGARVGAAWDLDVWGAVSLVAGGTMYTARCIPHPSGLNRAYNDPRARQAAQAALLWAAGAI